MLAELMPALSSEALIAATQLEYILYSTCGEWTGTRTELSRSISEGFNLTNIRYTALASIEAVNITIRSSLLFNPKSQAARV